MISGNDTIISKVIFLTKTSFAPCQGPCIAEPPMGTLKHMPISASAWKELPGDKFITRFIVYSLGLVKIMEGHK